MLVQINTDNRLEGSAAENAAFEERVRTQLARFADRLTRVEVYIRDRDGDRNGPQGIEASVEARPAGGAPYVTSERAADRDTALNGALRKAHDSIERAFARQDAVR